MTRLFRLAAFLPPLLCVGGAVAQTATNQATTASAEPSSSPVAFVYVTRPTHIDGFAAASNGKLTPVPGSPYAGITVNSLSVNSKYLFGGSDDGTDILTFSIASNGSLHYVADTDTALYNPGYQEPIGPVQIDASGQTIYTQVVNSDSQILIQSYKIESNGRLQYLGNVNTNEYDGEEYLLPPKVLASDKFVYQGADIDIDDTEGGFINTYKRASNGLLETSSATSELPPVYGSVYVYYLDSLAPDPSNHLAVALEPLDGEYDNLGNVLLASYTAESNGNLVTNSTYQNMPTTELPYIGASSISPSGKLLAVGGQGFQVFHFNGGNPITSYSGLLQPDFTFVKLSWDKANHLYALSTDGLFVYTVTPTSITQAPGSPYPIPESSSVIVLSK